MIDPIASPSGGARPLQRGPVLGSALALLTLVACGSAVPPPVAGEEQALDESRLRPASALRCDADNGGLTLPPGFCAFVVAENVGRARHMAVRRNGDLYVAINPARDGSDPGRLLALRDWDGDGRADVVATLATTGGNGLTLDSTQTALYFAQNDRVLRYRLFPGLLRPIGAPELLLSGLPTDGDHPSKTIVLDGLGGFYLNHGSGSNACQEQNRVPFSPGKSPCPELAVRAGVWRFSALRLNQTLADGVRFATGTRNMNALARQPGSGELWGAQNGRDQLFENWPDRYTADDDRLAPAEEVLRLTRGYNNGWPYCYEDPRLGQKVLAPEYGGDGRRRGLCALIPPAALLLPAHWAPLAMLFYTGAQFPAEYREDAFVTTHGVRFPAPPEGPGYNVLRLRFSGGRPVASEVFADGFTGGATDLPEGAENRPVGLAQGVDGSLYISSDQLPGRIWRVIYQGAR